jgi:DNA repair exonuclease SbcCD nuclease subunit
MRILHLADTHLGFRQFPGKLDPVKKLNQRECDVYAAWHRAIDIGIERRVDAVVHAGDLFDSARPSPRALAEAIDGFARLRDAEIPVIAIAGNHSTPRFRSGGSVFEVLQRFGVHAAWERPEVFRVGSVAFHAVPHEADAARLQEDIRAMEPDPSAESNVLILHAGLDAVPAPSYGEVNAISVSSEVIVEAPFDYIAMGHLHRFQAPQVNAIYPGSLERLDFADLEGDKAVLEIDLGTGAGLPGFVTRHPLKTRPMFDSAVDCEGCDESAVIARVEEQLRGKELDGAVVRVRFQALQRDVWGALDFARLDELFAPCLHHQVQVGHGGLRTTLEDEPAHELRFDAFARDRMPAGLDPERVIALARGFLDEAAATEIEEAAA